MNKTNIHEPDLDNLLKRALEDDLPPEAEARMSRQFLGLKRGLYQTEPLPQPDGWLWVRGKFRKEILAVASMAMIILGLVMQLSGSQNTLAYSIDKLKVIVTISDGLNRASSMDCAVMTPSADGGKTSYRIRWRAIGDVRVDMDSASGAQTLWISDETVSVTGPGGGDVRSMPISTLTPGPVWQPALEFVSPRTLAKHMEEQYGLMQSVGRSSIGTDEFLIVGQEGQQDVEITVDEKTYLPKSLHRYSHDLDRINGERKCILEARFLWNQLIPAESFSPPNRGAGR